MALVIVNGRLGQKPETKFSKSGTEYITFSMAYSEKKGQQEETTWFRCVWMNGANAGILSFLDKGSLVSVVGRLQKPKVFQKKDGSSDVDLTIFVNDVNFLPSSKPTTEKKEYAQSASVHAPQNGTASTEGQQEELPF